MKRESRESVSFLSEGPPTFPLARLRKQRDESEVIDNTSGMLDEVDHSVVQDGTDVEELFTDDPDPPKASSSAEPYDARGQGDICEVTGVPIRRYKGSTRPPGINPEVWRMYTAKDKRTAIAKYLDEIEKDSAARARPTPASAGSAAAATPRSKRRIL